MSSHVGIRPFPTRSLTVETFRSEVERAVGAARDPASQNSDARFHSIPSAIL
jgi:hypothetical protein